MVQQMGGQRGSVGTRAEQGQQHSAGAVRRRPRFRELGMWFRVLGQRVCFRLWMERCHRGDFWMEFHEELSAASREQNLYICIYGSGLLDRPRNTSIFLAGG